MQRIMNYTNKNPWMWGVFVIAIGLPVVLIFSFCCGSSQVFFAARFRKLSANVFLFYFKLKYISQLKGETRAS